MRLWDPETPDSTGVFCGPTAGQWELSRTALPLTVHSRRSQPLAVGFSSLLRLRALGFSALPRLPALPHRSACSGDCSSTQLTRASRPCSWISWGSPGARQKHEGQSPTPRDARGRDMLQDCNLRHCLISQACKPLPSPRFLGVFSRNAATSISYK